MGDVNRENGRAAAPAGNQAGNQPGHNTGNHAAAGHSGSHAGNHAGNREAARAGNGQQADDKRPPLPRRRRQANLAPQLTGDAEEPVSMDASPDDPDGVGQAERARNRMAAFQRGTREGRQGP
jgi:hypothetical protein